MSVAMFRSDEFPKCRIKIISLYCDDVNRAIHNDDISICQNIYDGMELVLYDRLTTQMTSVLTDPVTDILTVWFDPRWCGNHEGRYLALLKLPHVLEVAKRWNYQDNYEVTPGRDHGHYTSRCVKKAVHFRVQVSVIRICFFLIV